MALHQIARLSLADTEARFGFGEDKADQGVAFTETCVIADLDTAAALSAADLCTRQKLATADAIVYATARAHGADLLTCDRHFERLPGVRFVPKSKS